MCNEWFDCSDGNYLKEVLLSTYVLMYLLMEVLGLAKIVATKYLPVPTFGDAVVF